MHNDDLLQWGPQFVTGIDAIDSQHMILVEMLHDAHSRMGSLVSRSEVEGLVRDLLAYALYHFETEEELMADHGYAQEVPADAASHVKEHRDFSTTVASVQQDLMAGKLVTRESLLGFLNNWLVNHILNTDMRFAEFLRKSQAT